MSLRMRIGAKLTGRTYVGTHRRKKQGFGNAVKRVATLGMGGYTRVSETTRRGF